MSGRIHTHCMTTCLCNTLAQIGLTCEACPHIHSTTSHVALRWNDVFPLMMRKTTIRGRKWSNFVPHEFVHGPKWLPLGLAGLGHLITSVPKPVNPWKTCYWVTIIRSTRTNRSSLKPNTKFPIQGPCLRPRRVTCAFKLLVDRDDRAIIGWGSPCWHLQLHNPSNGA